LEGAVADALPEPGSGRSREFVWPIRSLLS